MKSTKKVIFIMQGLCYVVDITMVLITFVLTFDVLYNLIDFHLISFPSAHLR